MASVDWSARPDQIEGLALREVGVSSFILMFPYKFMSRHRNTPQYSSHSAMVPRLKLPL